MRCRSCNAELRFLEYQSRSADEAHTTVYKCPNCPVDVDRFIRPRADPHIFLRRRSVRPPLTKRSESIFGEKKTIIRISTKNFKGNHGRILESTASHILDTKSRLFKVYSKGVWEHMSISVLKRRRLSLNVSVEETLVAYNTEVGYNEYIDFKYFELDNDIVVVDGDTFIFTRILDDDLDDTVLNVITEAYTLGFCPESISPYVSNILLGSISNLNARAYDAPSAEDHHHLFSSKPDGERMWLVKSGSIWFYCRRLLNYSVESFFVDNLLSEMTQSKISTVIDVEVMIGHPNIVIDVLMEDEGKLAPHNRDVQWIEQSIRTMSLRMEYIRSLYVRPFFHTMKEAIQYTSSVLYPTDGIVAIGLHGTDMKKIKEIKSMELQVSKDSILVSKEGTGMVRITGNSDFKEGDIVEIRFRLDGLSFMAYDIFQRTDKSSANDNSAIDSILASFSRRNSDSMIRNILWRWSNSLRFAMYKRARLMGTTRNIVIDIGPGNGQSSEAYNEIPGCSFILVEPDESKCKMLCRRLGVKGYDSSPRSFIPLIPQLKKNIRKYHILNCRLQDLLSDGACVNNIRLVVKCAIACFSTQYIMGSIDELNEIGVPFMGSYYSYDGIDIGDSIIHAGNVEMKRITSTEARVKWGKDSVYTEPIPAEDEMPLTCSEISGTDMAPLSGPDVSPDIVKACSHVKVLISS